MFLVQNGIATFRPVKVGIAGDEYFEVVDGLRGGETIVAGTYQAIRDLKDGAKVKEADSTSQERRRRRRRRDARSSGSAGWPASIAWARS